MKKYGVATSVMLFSTLLGLVLPIQAQVAGHQKNIFQSKIVKADDVDTKTQNIADATDKVNEALAQVKLDGTANLSGISDDVISQLNDTFEANLTRVVSLFQGPNGYITKYNAGQLTDQEFLDDVNTKVIAGGSASLSSKALPIDWESAAQLIALFVNRRQQQINNADLNADQLVLANKVAGSSITKYTDVTQMATKVSKSNTTEEVSVAVNALLKNDIDGTKSATTGQPNSTQLADAQFFLESIANSRKTAINSLKSSSDDSKAAAIKSVTDALEEYKSKLNDATLTVGSLAKLVSGFATEVQVIVPASDINVVTDSDRSAALSTLDKLNETSKDTLGKVTGFDVEIKAAQNTLSELYAKYKNEIATANTLNELGTIATNSKKDFDRVLLLLATDDEKTAGINAINAAVTSQTAIINADTQASDAEKATAITTINNTANHYIPMIEESNTTIQVLKSAQTGAISTIKATTAMHNQLATTAQRNAAMNAIITAGNTKKVAIQNNPSIAAADKTVAYAAVDKLVTSYTDQMKTAKLTTNLTKLQTTGVAAVTAFQATKSATTSTTTTEPTTTDATNTVAKSSTKKVLYAISGLKLYKSDSLKGKAVASYAKHKRTNRPTFLVTKTVKNDAGKKVYYVQNQASGKTGYITSSTKSVAYAYYQTTPKKVRVITKGGVNQYKKANLSTKQKHYKKGQTLKVKKLIKSGVTTRFQLTNGNYISANKKFVIDTQY